MEFCSACGAKVDLEIPPGVDRPRSVCSTCKIIHYSNPRMVVGAIPELEGQLLLCRRAIEPERGKWTLPAGYLENGESVVQCALRETREEAGAELEKLQPYALIDLPAINLLYFMFRARLKYHRFQPGSESLEVKLTPPAEIPWSELAFDSMKELLKCYCEDLEAGSYPFRMITIDVKK